MWQRLKRVVRANLGRLGDLGGGGGGLAAAGREELGALERELKAVQGSLAELRGQARLLEEKGRRAEQREPELRALIEAATQRGAADAAGRYASELEAVRAERAAAARQLEVARAALDKGERARATFVEALERKRGELAERRRALAELQAEDAAVRGGHDADLALARAGLAAPGGPPSAAPAAGPPDALDAGARAKTIGVEATPPAGVPTASPPPGAKTIGAPPEPRPAAPAGPPVGPKTIGPQAVAPRPIERLAIKVRPLGGEAPPAAQAPVAPEVAAAPAAQAAGAGRDVVSELERLARLHAAGVLTADELAQAKRKLLGDA